jgi:hypothetical protein
MSETCRRIADVLVARLEPERYEIHAMERGEHRQLVGAD